MQNDRSACFIENVFAGNGLLFAIQKKLLEHVWIDQLT